MPTDKTNLVQPLATLIRGHRPLLQLPFLSFDADSTLNAQFAISDMLSRIKDKYEASEKELEQFSKMIRNASFGGANNRFLRSLPESEAKEFYELSMKFENRGSPWIKTFLPNLDISKGLRNTNGLSENFLMPPRVFFEKHTNNGLIFHGTPNVSAALSILKGEFF